MKRILFALMLLPTLAMAGWEKHTSSVTGTMDTAITFQSAGPGVQKETYLVSGFVRCSGACTILVERGGDAATATAGTIVNSYPRDAAPTTVVYTASDAGDGTDLMSGNMEAAGTYPIAFSSVRVEGTQPATVSPTGPIVRFDADGPVTDQYTITVTSSASINVTFDVVLWQRD